MRTLAALLALALALAFLVLASGCTSTKGSKEIIDDGQHAVVRSPETHGPPPSPKAPPPKTPPLPKKRVEPGPDQIPPPAAKTSKGSNTTQIPTPATATGSPNLPPVAFGEEHGSTVQDAPRASGEPQLGLWIELLNRDGNGGIPVAPDRVFHSGEHVRLHVRATAPGYVSVLQFDAAGVAHPVYPAAKMDPAGSYLQADVERAIPPPPASLWFSGKPDMERLSIVFALAPSDPATLSPRLESSRDGESKGIHTNGAKIIQLYIPDKPTQGPHFSASNPGGGPVVVYLNLAHE